MKRKAITVTAVAVIFALLVSYLLAEQSFSYAPDEDILGGYKDSFKSTDDSAWEHIAAGEAVLENEQFILKMDVATTRFTITDKKTGHSFDSYPQDGTPVTTQDEVRFGANVAVDYYTADNVEGTMSSAKDCTDDGAIRVLKYENTLRAYYKMGFSAEASFIPMVFTPEVYDALCEKLGSPSAVRQLNRYYTFFSSGSVDEAYETMLGKYPDLETHDLYIFSSKLNEVTISDVSFIMENVGYTAEQYVADTAGLDLPETAATPSGFTVAVDYTLAEQGVSAAALMDKLTASNLTDKPVTLYLLEFFGAAQQDTGSFLVPDGAGAVIDLSGPSAADYYQKIYAQNPSIPQKSQSQLAQQALLPIFGFMGTDRAYLARIKGGAAVSTVTARIKNGSNIVNNIAAAFDLYDHEEITIGADRGLPLVNMYSPSHITENPCIDYYISGEKRTAAELAAIYSRNISETDGENDDAPVYLDFICAVNNERNILGVPYNKLEVLISLSEITEVVKQLGDSGVKNINVRLKGLLGGGLYNGAVNGLSIDGKIGSREEFIELKSIVEKNGKLYIDVPLALVWRNAMYDGYPQRAYNARRMNDTISIYNYYDAVTLRYIAYGAYVVSPRAYYKALDRVINDYRDDEMYAGVGLSWSDITSVLPADYSKSAFTDRCMTAEIVKNTFKKLHECSGSVMTDSAAEYALEYADIIIDAPLYSSKFLSESYEVPFYAAALKGKRGYAGCALNLSSNFEGEAAISAASGAGLYFMWTGGNDEAARRAGLPFDYYSLDYRRSIDRLKALYGGYNENYKALRGSPITAFEVLETNVVRISYGNGASVTANYSRYNFNLSDDKIIEAGTFERAG